MKAYCTVEAVLLDVRTGIVPYTTVAFKEVSGQRAPGDLSFDETTDKAYRDAEAQALLQVAEGLKAFLQSV